MQQLQFQASIAQLLLSGATLAFEACTDKSSTGAALSAKERRCVQGGVVNFIEARSHIKQALEQQARAAGHDM